jgi:hypothetical protein
MIHRDRFLYWNILSGVARDRRAQAILRRTVGQVMAAATVQLLWTMQARRLLAHYRRANCSRVVGTVEGLSHA